MIRRYATAADFTRWEALALTMTPAQLRYASADCFAVASNWAGVDDMVESFYRDQGLTFADAYRDRVKL